MVRSFKSPNDAQLDATHFADSLVTAKKYIAVLVDIPKVVAFLYIKFISPSKGFGLFSGEDIPYRQSDFSPLCLGTYGGMICASEREALYSKMLYSMTHGHLPRIPEPTRVNLPKDVNPRTTDINEL